MLSLISVHVFHLYVEKKTEGGSCCYCYTTAAVAKKLHMVLYVNRDRSAIANCRQTNRYFNNWPQSSSPIYGRNCRKEFSTYNNVGASAYSA